MTTATPFHEGELDAQRRAGAAGVASAVGGFIRDHMPEQHRDFFAMLPFVVIAAGDEQGRPWVSLLEGEDGFIASPDPRTLTVAARLGAGDPLAATLGAGSDIGLLGIELATRRRNRLNGVIRPVGDAFAIEVRQSFGNCPQYIHEREWRRVAPLSPPEAVVSDRLDAGQCARIRAADTCFIGSGHLATEAGASRGDASRGDASRGDASRGYDASHRGGEPGFVRVDEDGTLHLPDYAGNHFFNTIGNLLRDPRVGLLFVDFDTGGLLQITGRARVDWTAAGSHDPDAQRMIEIVVERVVDRPGALALRWHRQDAPPLRLEVIDKVRESDQIASFLLADAEGGALPPFAAGQHLAVELEVPRRSGRVGRSYSLSGSPLAGTYRLSVKREPQGTASRFLHDHVEIGDRLEARRPSGEFVLPGGDGPLVLVSAGVGITPMLSMLHAVVARGGDRPVWFVHGTRDGSTHAFRAEVDALLSAAGRVVRRIFYSAPRASDRPGLDYQAKGRITAEDLLALEAGPEACYLFCGPAGLLTDLSAGLEAGGVSPARIDFETFGPSVMS